ncbi:D-tyrosyl-tRNA(Tyr) deacylase [Nocardioides sp. PD653]|nr:D-tyrosyl-tRNA(Tyr) deacylase [Nocardioides sp. PD653]
MVEEVAQQPAVPVVEEVAQQPSRNHLRETASVRAVIHRVLRASVTVDDVVVGAIDEPGLLVYLGVTHGDGDDEIRWMARKVWELRLLRDEQSASETGAPVLVVSQFTLYGDARKGRRPTWQAAAPGTVSEPAYDAVCAELERLGARVARGVFGADMRVESVNDGPVTLLLDKEPVTASGAP